MVNLKYKESLKKDIVNLYASGRSAAELSSEYQISLTSIYKWIKIYSKYSISDQKTFSDMQINKIQTENLRLKQEVVILKQALSITLITHLEKN